MRRLLVLTTALALVTVACASAAEPQEAPQTTTRAPSAESAAFTIVGQDIAFDVTTLTAGVGQEVTITFENLDAAIPHNLMVEGPSGPIATAVESGVVTQTLTFTIDEAGTYAFVCEVHPVRMAGELVIEG